jgi:cysteine desulfurase
MSFTAHKIYGPKGIGALYVRRRNPGIRLQSQIDGGGQEHGMRSGTLNVPGIVGLGKASELCGKEMPAESRRLQALRDKLEQAFLKLPDTYLNGHPKNRLPHVSNIAFGHVEGESLKLALHRHVAISSGSACSSASMEPSHVLKAYGLGDLLAQSSYRFSLGRFLIEEEIITAILQVSDTVSQMREQSGAWQMYITGKYENSDEWRPL